MEGKDLEKLDGGGWDMLLLYQMCKGVLEIVYLLIQVIESFGCSRASWEGDRWCVDWRRRDN